MPRSIAAALTLALVLALGAGYALGHSTRDDYPVTWMQLPLKFPAVGNIEGVRQWRFGRVETIERHGDSDDIVITLRTERGSVRLTGPREPLRRLAATCGWVSGDMRHIAGRRDYVERMIAFDVDADGRLIAALSLEPINRSDSRLERAYRGRR